MQLKGDRRRPTGEYINDLRSKVAADFSRSAIFLSARGHRDADFEFWIAGAHRCADYRRKPAGQLQGGGKTRQASCGTSPARPTYTCSRAFDQPTLHMDIDRTRVQNLGLQARDVAQNLLVSSELQFSDHADVLAGSQKRSQLQRRGANAAISRGQLPVAAKHSGDRKRTEPPAADSGQPGDHLHDGTAGSNFTLQCSAHD